MSELFHCFFFVPGEAKSKGSMRAFVSKSTGKAIAVPNTSTALKDWENTIKSFAMEHRPPEPLEGPVKLDLLFSMRRPKKIDKVCRGRPIKRPDVDKLTRAVLDGLTKIMFKDDSQVVDIHCVQRYCGGDCSAVPGVQVAIWEMSG